MPSTLFHAGVGFLLATALLDRFDRRAAGVVILAVLLPELDTLIGLWIVGAHRAYTNNVFFVAGIAALVRYDAARARSLARRLLGPDGPRVARTGVVVLAVAGVGVDLFFNGVNLLFPVVDQFYDLSGEVLYSTQRGFVQTMIDLEESTRGSTQTTQYRTGVDPDPASPGAEPATVERVFPLSGSGLQFLITVTGFAVAGYRLRQDD